MSDKAAFADSHQYPEGFRYVIVNDAVVVLDDGKMTEARPGQVLLKQVALQRRWEAKQPQLIFKVICFVLVHSEFLPSLF